MPSVQTSSVPRGIVRVTGVSAVAVQEIFPGTTGKVKISHILVRPESQVTGATPLIVTLQAVVGTPVYATAFFGLNSATVVLPGFELPAGGLEATSGLATPLATVEVFYHTSP